MVGLYWWNDHPRTVAEVMTEQKIADRAFGGIRPVIHEGESVWPPRRKPGWSAMAIIKRIQAFITGGQLVWLRDHDEIQSLAVANLARDGKLYSARFWPGFRALRLNENGTVVCLDNENGKYTRNWVATDESKMIFMAIQNSEVYAEPLKDHNDQEAAA